VCAGLVSATLRQHIRRQVSERYHLQVCSSIQVHYIGRYVTRQLTQDVLLLACGQSTKGHSKHHNKKRQNITELHTLTTVLVCHSLMYLNVRS